MILKEGVSKMPARYWMILIALGAAFGGSFSLNEILLEHYGPLSVSAMRVALGAIGCWVWVLATGRKAANPASILVGLFAFGVFQYAAPFALLPMAQEEITSSVAGIANAMTPIAVVVISHFWAGGEKATGTKLAGVSLGLFGIVLLSSQGSVNATSDPRYIALAMGAPISYGIALNLIRRFRGIDPVVITAWAMTGGAVAIAPVAIASEGVPAIPAMETALVLGILGFGLTSAAFLIMFSMLSRVGATNLSLVTFVAPVSAMMIGALFLGEEIGAGHVSGAFLILLGLVCIDGRGIQALRQAVIGSPAPLEVRG